LRSGHRQSVVVVGSWSIHDDRARALREITPAALHRLAAAVMRTSLLESYSL